MPRPSESGSGILGTRNQSFASVKHTIINNLLHGVALYARFDFRSTCIAAAFLVEMSYANLLTAHVPA